jgi:D-alanine-D-alanine ligase-like ATP-grasp enzyme
LPQSTQFEIYSAAVNAVESLGTAGLARVDLMLDANGSVWILEVNTIPGLTAKSLAPRAARAAGIDMPMLMDWMVRDALRKAQPQISAEQHLRIIRHATANSGAILGAGT